MAERLTWCEISGDALRQNLAEFRRLVGPACRLAPVVKANAYGHGLELAARVFAQAGADALCVHDLWEARRVRDAGVALPVLILGPLLPEQAPEAVQVRDLEFTVSHEAVVSALEAAARSHGCRVPVFVKVETGTNRQGLRAPDAVALARRILASRALALRGLTMHFADIEDTTDHTFARTQIERFHEAVAALDREGAASRVLSCANSAATILWPEAHLDMVRVGIGAYGMWPSTETFVAAALTHRHRLNLRPALTWKTVVTEVKDVPAGEFIGYGRTYRTTHLSRIAVLPVGYYDGYDRGVSNVAFVLVRGRRAQVRGRVCMNLIMVDVTDIPDVRPGDKVILLGHDTEDAISAERFAQWANTINYEVTTRIAESVPRRLV